MTKFIYRLDLTPDELKKFKDKLDVELLIKFKKIEISEKKIDSMKKASSVKIEATRRKFENSLLRLKEQKIEPTQYNLRKYANISYTTSKKYLELLKIAENNIKGISKNNHRVLDEKEIAELKINDKCIYELEKFLLEEMEN